MRISIAGVKLWNSSTEARKESINIKHFKIKYKEHLKK